MSISSREAIQRLEAEGWRCARQKGSHKQFKHPDRPGLITVPHPKAMLSIGVIKDIETKSGLRLR